MQASARFRAGWYALQPDQALCARRSAVVPSLTVFQVIRHPVWEAERHRQAGLLDGQRQG